MVGTTTTIGTSMISSVLLPMVEKAASLLLDRALDQYDSMVNIQRDIRSLKIKLNEVNGILQEAEERQIDNINVRELLRELVDVGYDARDVLDDFVTAASIDARRTSRWVMLNCFPSSFFLRCFGTRFQLANDIKSVIERLDEIMEQSDIVHIRKSLRKGGSKSESASRRRETTCYVNRQRNLFVGKELEKDEIIRKLVRHDGNGVLVVPIWGVGGVGKTTLAQSIYNDERVKEDYPICNRKWLLVGEKKFNAQEIMERIIGESNHPDFVDIQGKLVENFKGNKFLIVLDDVWDLDSNQWNLLFDPLTNVGKGGVIIITTRKREVISATNTLVPTDLRPLYPEGCWKIFESHAFVDGKSSNRPEMEPIGREIVEKLDGLPLAAQVVGSSLLNEPDATWSDFINNWERNLRNNDNEIMAALRWSYKLLPTHLKHCFAYCALFPKDHEFDENVLVEMWMAHDLIQINGDGRPEDIGSRYFKELTYASLIQYVDKRYVMHDMIHDLAFLVSNEEFSSTIGSLSTDQMEKVRHITIPIDNEYSKNLSSCKSKRILTVYTPYNKWDETSTTPLDNDILLEVFRQSKSLRVLVLSNKHISEIPECIIELKHLRYLDVKKTSVQSLPNSLCELHHLQMLAAPLDAVLPRDIVNIRSLRYLRASLPTSRGIEKLTSLQELSSIHVCEGDNIRELGDMRQLRGKLTVNGLENISSSQEAAQALMQDKLYLDELELEFSRDLGESSIVTDVLDALRCPPNLECLKIVGYTGLKPPSWMVDGKYKFDKLQKLELSNCPKLEFLPPLGELNLLKHLCLRSIHKVERLGDKFYGKGIVRKVLFPSLETLDLDDMKKWMGWDDIIINDTSASFFPCLTRLRIHECPKLLSALPPVEKNTSILKDKHTIMNAVNFMKSLSHLEIRNCHGLVVLQLDVLVSLKSLEIHCNGLETLKIKSCEHLEMMEFERLPSLKTLDIRSCNKLISIPSLVGIKCLYLYGCESLRSLSIDIHGLNFLEHLEIFHCPILELIFEDGSSSSSCSMNLAAVRLQKLQRICTNDKHIFTKLFHQDPICLEYLHIEDFSKKEENNLCKLKSLKSLHISSCEDLKSLPSEFYKLSSLNSLKIEYCPKLQSLPPDFHKHSSLNSLYINCCPQLRSLPALGLPPSIESLDILNCPLLYERCKDESGRDWHKIKHIPKITIFGDKVHRYGP